MNSIALSIEQMKHLEELGLDTSDASMYYELESDMLLPNSFPKINKVNTYIPSYTLQDIINKMPCGINCKKEQFNWGIGYVWLKDNEGIILSDDPLLAAYNMLCYCIKNNLIKIDKDNESEV